MHTMESLHEKKTIATHLDILVKFVFLFKRIPARIIWFVKNTISGIATWFWYDLRLESIMIANYLMNFTQYICCPEKVCIVFVLFEAEQTRKHLFASFADWWMWRRRLQSIISSLYPPFFRPLFNVSFQKMQYQYPILSSTFNGRTMWNI